jgi:hypothetical protein
MLPFIDRYIYAPIYWSQYVYPNLLVAICMPPFNGRNIMPPFIGRYLYAITNVSYV